MTRLLTRSEIDLIKWIIRDSKESINIIPNLPTLLVEEMNDRGMGSLRVVSDKNRFYSRDISEVELMDIDGVYLLIIVNVVAIYFYSTRDSITLIALNCLVPR